MLQFINTMTSELSETRGAADMALQLFLTAAEAACEVQGLDDLAYELFEQVSRVQGLIKILNLRVPWLSCALATPAEVCDIIPGRAWMILPRSCLSR